MSATLIVEKAKRKTERIRDENERLEEEIRVLKQRHVDNLQSAILGCSELGDLWHRLVEIVSEAWQTFDYRKFGPQIAFEAQRTVSLCDSIIEMGKNLKPEHSLDGLCDVELLRHETLNILSWIEDWPTNDPEFREQSRDDIRAGRCSPIEAFSAVLQE